LHCAFKSGNLEIALWIIQIVRKEQGFEAYAELLNSMDHVRKLHLKNVDIGRDEAHRHDGFQN